MRKATRRLGRLSGIIAAGVAIAATGSGVMAASYSTFSASAPNTANTWNSGSLTLVNDASSTAMFTVPTTVLSGVKCIKVSSGGSYNGEVDLWGAGSSTGSLADHINLTVDVGAATGNTGGFSGCGTFAAASPAVTWSGKLSAFNTAFPSYGTSFDTGWLTPVSSSDSRVFRFTWSYDSTAPQNQTATNAFTWEVHSS